MVLNVLQAVGNSLLSVFTTIGKGLLNALPGVIGAIVILLIGYWVALAVEWIVENGLKKLKTDKRLIKDTGLNKTLGDLSLEKLASFLSKWYVFVLFFMPAADIVKLATLASFLKMVAEWVPALIGASLLGLLGVVTAGYVKNAIIETKVKSAKLVADFVNVIILVVTALVVLGQVGFNLNVVNVSFVIILSGVMLAIALALGIGFGLALKDEAKKSIRDFMKRL